MDSRHLPILIAVIGVGLVYLYWQLNKKNQLLEEQIYYLQAHVQRLTNPVSQERHEPIEVDLDEHVVEQEEPLINQQRVIEEVVNYGYEEDEEDTEEDTEEESEPEPANENEEESGIREIGEEVTPAEDVVITKLSHCPHILQSGKNKGMLCGKQGGDNGYCKNHSAPEPLN